MAKDLKNAKRIVIKVGTSTLTHDTGLINLRRMEILVRVLADIQNAGREVILVSSGAIAVGTQKLGLAERPKNIPTRQATAAVGQCELMYMYDKMFSEYGKIVAQVLLTRDVVENPALKINACNTFRRLLELKSIPIVNENDTVSLEEIGIGDNDNLSAIVAILTEADTLVLLSDIDGLYDSDPKNNPQALLIPYVYEIDEQIESLAGSVGSKYGTGGMVTKLQAAKLAYTHDIPMVLINGNDPCLLYDVLDGRPQGTLFTRK